MLAGMELRHLRYFVAVAEEQNVTRAAARLHVSQPPLSRQIRDLEDELGVALFDHGAKAVRLTEAGRVLLVEARAALQRVDEAVQLTKAVASGKRGQVRVGYAASLTVEILPRTLRLLQEASPGICVQLHDLTTQEMLRGLREHKLDAALLVLVSPKVLAEFEVEELCRYPVCVAMNNEHPLARAREVGLKHLIKEPIISFTLSEYPEHHAWMADLFAPFPRPPQILEEHESATSLIAAVEAGHGVALVSESLSMLAGSRLKLRPLEPAPLPLAVGLAYRKDGRSSATMNFVNAAKRARDNAK